MSTVASSAANLKFIKCRGFPALLHTSTVTDPTNLSHLDAGYLENTWFINAEFLAVAPTKLFGAANGSMIN